MEGDRQSRKPLVTPWPKSTDSVPCRSLLTASTDRRAISGHSSKGRSRSACTLSQAFSIFSELCRVPGVRRMDPRTATLAMFGAINWVSTWYDPASDKSASELAGELVQLYLQGVAPTDGIPTEALKDVVDRALEDDLEVGSARTDRG